MGYCFGPFSFYRSATVQKTPRLGILSEHLQSGRIWYYNCFYDQQFIQVIPPRRLYLAQLEISKPAQAHPYQNEICHYSCFNCIQKTRPSPGTGHNEFFQPVPQLFLHLIKPIHSYHQCIVYAEMECMWHGIKTPSSRTDGGAWGIYIIYYYLLNLYIKQHT